MWYFLKAMEEEKEIFHVYEIWTAALLALLAAEQ